MQRRARAAARERPAKRWRAELSADDGVIDPLAECAAPALGDQVEAECPAATDDDDDDRDGDASADVMVELARWCRSQRRSDGKAASSCEHALRQAGTGASRNPRALLAALANSDGGRAFLRAQRTRAEQVLQTEAGGARAARAHAALIGTSEALGELGAALAHCRAALRLLGVQLPTPEAGDAVGSGSDDELALRCTILAPLDAELRAVLSTGAAPPRGTSDLCRTLRGELVRLRRRANRNGVSAHSIAASKLTRGRWHAGKNAPSTHAPSSRKGWLPPRRGRHRGPEAPRCPYRALVRSPSANSSTVTPGVRRR